MNYRMSVGLTLGLVTIIFELHVESVITSKRDKHSGLNGNENKRRLEQKRKHFVFAIFHPDQKGGSMQEVSKDTSFSNEKGGKSQIPKQSVARIGQRRPNLKEARHSISNNEINILHSRSNFLQKDVAIEKHSGRTTRQVWSSSAYVRNEIKQRMYQREPNHISLPQLTGNIGNKRKQSATPGVISSIHFRSFLRGTDDTSLSKDGTTTKRLVPVRLKSQPTKMKIVDTSTLLPPYHPPWNTAQKEAKRLIKNRKSAKIITTNHFTSIPKTHRARIPSFLNGIIKNDIYYFSYSYPSDKSVRNGPASTKLKADGSVGEPDKVGPVTKTRHVLTKRDHNSKSDDNDDDILTRLGLLPLRNTSDDSFSSKWSKLKKKLNEMYENLMDTQSEFKEIEHRVKMLLKEGDQLDVEVEKQRNWSVADDALRDNSLRQLEAARNLFERKVAEEDKKREKIEQEFIESSPGKNIEEIQRELDNEQMKMVGERKMNNYLGLQIRYPVKRKDDMTSDKTKEYDDTMLDSKEDLYNLEKYRRTLVKNKHFPDTTGDADLKDVDIMLDELLSRKVRNAEGGNEETAEHDNKDDSSSSKDLSDSDTGTISSELDRTDDDMSSSSEKLELPDIGEKTSSDKISEISVRQKTDDLSSSEDDLSNTGTVSSETDGNDDERISLDEQLEMTDNGEKTSSGKKHEISGSQTMDDSRSLEDLPGTGKVLSRTGRIDGERGSLGDRLELSDTEAKSLSSKSSEPETEKVDPTGNVPNQGDVVENETGSNNNMDDDMVRERKHNSLTFDKSEMNLERGRQNKKNDRVQHTDQETSSDVRQKSEQMENKMEEDETMAASTKQFDDESNYNDRLSEENTPQNSRSFPGRNQTGDSDNFNGRQSDQMNVDETVDDINREDLFKLKQSGTGKNKIDDKVSRNGDLDRQENEKFNSMMTKLEQTMTKERDPDDKKGNGTNEKIQTKEPRQKEFSLDKVSEDQERVHLEDIDNAIDETKRDLRQLESYIEKSGSKHIEMQEQSYIREQQELSDSLNQLSQDLENFSHLRKSKAAN